MEEKALILPASCAPCVTNPLWHHAWWILAAVTLLLTVRISFLRYVTLRLLVLGFLAGGAGTIFYELYTHPGEQMSLDQLLAALITYGAALYASACEVILAGYGKRLTERRGQKWAKELDYPYVFFGGLGLVVSLNRLDAVEAHLSGLEIVGPLIVTTAIVVRLIKTRVEIAGWNTKKFYGLPASNSTVIEERLENSGQTGAIAAQQRPPALTVAEIVQAIKDNFAVVSAAAAITGIAFAATFLAAYLSIFDWHLIWFVQYTDIITFGLVALVVGSGSVSLLQGFVGTILGGTTPQQRRNGIIFVVLFLIVSAALGVWTEVHQGHGFFYILFGVAASANAAVLIYLIAGYVEARAPPTPYQCISMLMSLLITAGALGAWLGHVVQENPDFNQDVYVKEQQLSNTKLIIVMSRYTVLLKDDVPYVVPTADITKFQASPKPIAAKK